MTSKNPNCPVRSSGLRYDQFEESQGGNSEEIMLEYLQQTIDWIDENPMAADCLDTVADRIGFSKSWLNHLFAICTGQSIMNYARRRRLEHALGMLWDGAARILDVALELGYSSDRAFARAVVEEFGQPPSYYRTHAVPRRPSLTAQDLRLRLDGDRLLAELHPGFADQRSALEKKGMKFMREYLSDVRYETLEPMIVISGIAVGAEPEEEIISRLDRLAKTYDLAVDRSFGFDVPLEERESLKTNRGYEAWLAVTEDQLAHLPNPHDFVFEDTTIRIRRIPPAAMLSCASGTPSPHPLNGSRRAGAAWSSGWNSSRCLIQPSGAARRLIVWKKSGTSTASRSWIFTFRSRSSDSPGASGLQGKGLPSPIQSHLAKVPDTKLPSPLPISSAVGWAVIVG